MKLLALLAVAAHRGFAAPVDSDSPERGMRGRQQGHQFAGQVNASLCKVRKQPGISFQNLARHRSGIEPDSARSFSATATRHVRHCEYQRFLADSSLALRANFEQEAFAVLVAKRRSIAEQGRRDHEPAQRLRRVLRQRRQYDRQRSDLSPAVRG